MVIKELFVKLGMDTDTASFAEGAAAGAGLVAVFEKLGEKVLEVVQEFKQLFIETAKETEQNARLAESLGVTLDAYEGLQHAAHATGVSTEALDTGLRFLQRSAFGVAEGSDEAAQMFKQLGVSVYDTNGKLKPADKLLGDVADRYSKMEPGIRKTGLALKIFGRGGSSVVPMLNLGREGLQKYREELEAWENSASRQAQESGPKYLHFLARIDDIWKKVRETLAGPVLESLANAQEEFLGWLNDNREEIIALAKAVGSSLRTALEAVTGAFKALIRGVQAASKWLKEHRMVAQALVFVIGSALVGGIVAATMALVPFIASLLAGAASAVIAWVAAAAPFVAIGAAILAVIFILDDLLVMIAGGDSMTEKLSYKWLKLTDDFTKYKSEDFWLLKALKGSLALIFDLQGAWEVFKASLKLDLAIASLLPGMGYLGNIADKITVDQSKFPQFFKDAIKDNTAAPFTPSATSPQASANMSSAAASGGVQQYMTPVQPNFQASFTIHAQPGQDPTEIANQTSAKMEEWWNSKMRETHNAVR